MSPQDLTVYCIIENMKLLPLRAEAREIAVCSVPTRGAVSTQLCRLLPRTRVVQLAPVAIVTDDAHAAVDL